MNKYSYPMILSVRDYSITSCIACWLITSNVNFTETVSKKMQTIMSFLYLIGYSERIM